MAWAAVSLVATVAMSVLLVPRFTDMFRDFGSAAELPLLTRLVARRSLLLGVAMVPMLLCVLGPLLRLERGARVALVAVAAVIALLVVVSVPVGMYLPIFRIAGTIAG